MFPPSTALNCICQCWFNVRPANIKASCRIGSDTQTTGLTLTTGVWENCMRGASNMNIHYDVTGLLFAVWKVTLRSTCLGCLSWPGRSRVVYS